MEHTLRGVGSYVIRIMPVASLLFTADQYDPHGLSRQRPDRGYTPPRSRLERGRFDDLIAGGRGCR